MEHIYLFKQVEKAFDIKRLPRPWNVAPNQPFEGGGLITYGFALLAILFIVGIFMIPLTGLGSTPLNQKLTLKPLAKRNASQVVFTQPFNLKARQNVRITADAPVNNSWAELNIDLINAKTMMLKLFYCR